MIFVDSNIPMYLVGGDHLNKRLAREKLESLIRIRERLVTDVEVQQEILHRYVAIDRRDAIGPAFDALEGIVDEIFPVDARDVTRARALVLASRTLSARDAIHVAIMERHDVSRILTFDRGFDELPGIARL